MDTSPWQGRRVLVTGCTGFLGGCVTRELLDRGATVVGLLRDRTGGAAFASERTTKQFFPVHGLVEDATRLHSAMAVHEVSAVFHLATSAPFGSDRGTVSVLRAVALYHPRIPVVMARPSGQLRLVLEDDDRPAISVGIARFGELFGGGDRKLFRLVPRTVLDLLTHNPATATDGPGRDFVWVRDAARACLAVAEAVGAGGEPLDFTFRTGWDFGERTMAGFIEEVFAGRTPELPVSEAAVNPLGWQPTESLSQAIGGTIAWYREFVKTRFVGTRAATGRKAA